MKTMMKYLAVVIVLFTMSIQPIEAQSRLNRFFAYVDCSAYYWVSKLAHPTNEFRSGYCDDYGDYVDVTVCSKVHTTKIRFYKNSSCFYRLEVLSDTDNFWVGTFEACNIIKNTVVNYLRDANPETVSNIEDIFGNLNNMDCRQLCLALLTYKLWRFPG